MAEITITHHEGKETLKKAASRKKRAAAYARVSTLEEEQEQSFEAQQAYYREMLGRDPALVLIGVYGDHGISGTSAEKRPGFQEMMSACRMGQIDAVYTKSISRFARNFSECLTYLRELKSLGIPVYFEKEHISSYDPGVEVLLSLLAVLAQEESNSISQNITLALQSRSAKGDPARGACYGYRRSRKALGGIHPWQICEEEAEKVRLAFRLYLEGCSFSAIARQLTDSKRKWSPRAVRFMLQREAYAGDLFTGKTYVSDYLSKRVKENKGERPRYYLKDHHPAIVSREVFFEVQRKMGKEPCEWMQNPQ